MDIFGQIVGHEEFKGVIFLCRQNITKVDIFVQLMANSVQLVNIKLTL